METTDQEFSAIQTACNALLPLPPEGRKRAMTYLSSRLDVTGSAVRIDEAASTNKTSETPKADSPTTFESFAELFDAAQPKGNADRALVAGYWIQVCQGSETFDGQRANSELKNLGHGISNITNALDSLKNAKPALALQLKKSGTSQQARKVYKLTVSGITAVKAMISGRE